MKSQGWAKAAKSSPFWHITHPAVPTRSGLLLHSTIRCGDHGGVGTAAWRRTQSKRSGPSLPTLRCFYLIAIRSSATARRGPSYWLLGVQLPEVRGQPSSDENARPPNNGSGDKFVSARRNRSGGFPIRGLATHGVEIVPRQHKAGANQRELDQERSVDEIFRRLRHPQRESAEELEYDGNPNDRKKPGERRERNRPEESQQSQIDDQDETDDDRRPPGVDCQRERPTPSRLASRPFGERGILQIFKHCPTLPRS